MFFPRWTNYLPAVLLAAAAGAFLAAVFAFWYWGTDKHFLAGYQPAQPVKYSHKLHVNDLGIDCRFCHANAEISSAAGVPSTEACMTCHPLILPESPEIIKLQKYFEANQPVPWVRVHKLPEYAYFDHSIHLHKGVACEQCHGRVDQMAEIRHDQPLTMLWCIECHLKPGSRVRDRQFITAFGWKPDSNAQTNGKDLVEKYQINARIDCSACHR